MFHEQARGLVEGGVDLLLIETCQDILEVKAAIFGVAQALRRDRHAAAHPGSDHARHHRPHAARHRHRRGADHLERCDVDVIGLNCSTGPEHMREPARYLTETRRLPVSIIPNAGLPINDGSGNAVYPLNPEPMAPRSAEIRGRLRRARGRRLLRHHARAPRARSSAAMQRARPPLGRLEPRLPRRVAARSAVGHRGASRRSTRQTRRPPSSASASTPRARARSSACCWPTTTTASSRSRAARWRRARTCSTSAWPLTERGRRGRQMRAARQACSRMSVEAPLVIDTTEAASCEAALEHVPGPRHHQLHQHGERPRSASTASCHSSIAARRRRRRPHHRRGRAWRKTARAQARGRPAHPRHRVGRIRPRRPRT